MNYYFLSIFLFLIITLSSCQSDLAEIPLSHKGQYIHFSGTIYDTLYHFDMDIVGDETNISYYNEYHPKMYYLYGSISNDTVTYQDFGSGMYSESDSLIPHHFKGIFKNNELIGTLIRYYDTIPIHFKADYSKSIPLDFFHSNDTLITDTNTTFKITQQIRMPYSRKYPLVQQACYSLMGDAHFQGHPLVFTKKELPKYEQHHSSPDKPSPTRFYKFNATEVLYNIDGLVVLFNSSLRFWNGIHEPFTSRHTTIDLKQQKIITLNDVLSPSQVKLIPFLLEQKFREQYNLPKPIPLSTKLLYDENHFMTNNYFITKSGIGFFYNPQEIAPFAMGTIELYLKFDEIPK